MVRWFDEHLKAPAKGEKVAEATSLLGEPLVAPAPGATARAGLEARLASAEGAWKRAPSNADSIIWYGRRLAYLGRYREAIRVFGDVQHAFVAAREEADETDRIAAFGSFLTVAAALAAARSQRSGGS